ncbi:hypothetical protein [Bisbaumannia pacifica]|uniref:Lipoprotein n=1 Tax=Bisbaumannia pacifica TaxID=77098 RepID=A0A510X876_9GAMM|nr:hypothetical protein [Halomonas pacifica]MBH8581454.1 hypothetical protein [Halomonas pacifica]GEK47648.1 hypothetical protein HPA02_19310 [Halomonas pacifica]
MKRVWLCALALLLLSGCAAAPPSAEPRELRLDAPRPAVMTAALELFTDRGYVALGGDARLGRLEFVRGDVRIRLDARRAGEGSRVDLRGWRHGRALAPHELDPLLVELEAELGLLP